MTAQGRRLKLVRIVLSLDRVSEATVKFERIDHPLASQRVKGEARLAIKHEAGRSRIADLRQQGAAKIRFPEIAIDPLEAVLINTAGGMTGGDRMDWTVELGPASSAVVTTQASEKVYRALHHHAVTRVGIEVGTGARLAWLPQETILFDRSAFRRKLTVDIAEGATALLCESVIFGRKAMGEQVNTADFRDSWSVRIGGRLAHREALTLTGDVGAQLQHRAVAGGAGASATVLLVGPDAERTLREVRDIVGEAGGASAWTVGPAGTGKLLARLLAEDGYDLRRRLVPLLGLLNGQAGLPKVWSL